MASSSMYVVPTPVLVQAPAEPVSLAEAKKFLKQEDLAEDDALIAALVTAAREWFEKATDRTFCTATWRIKLPSFSCCGVTAPRIELPNPPLVAVSSVTYLDTAQVEQTLDAATYVVVTARTPGLIEPAFGQTWPPTGYHPEAVTITYTAGVGSADDVPELVKAGIKLLAAHWYDHRGDTADTPPAVQRIAVAVGSMRF